MFDGNQMVNLVCSRRVLLINQTVLTAMPTPFNDEAAESGWNVS